MKEHTIIYVALDDSKRTIVAGILRPASEPELREIPNTPEHIAPFFRRLKRDDEVRACYEGRRIGVRPLPPDHRAGSPV